MGGFSVDKDTGLQNSAQFSRRAVIYQSRIRTQYTEEQVKELERVFEKRRYLSPLMRGELAERLNVHESKIQAGTTLHFLLYCNGGTIRRLIGAMSGTRNSKMSTSDIDNAVYFL